MLTGSGHRCEHLRRESSGRRRMRELLGLVADGAGTHDQRGRPAPPFAHDAFQRLVLDGRGQGQDQGHGLVVGEPQVAARQGRDRHVQGQLREGHDLTSDQDEARRVRCRLASVMMTRATSGRQEVRVVEHHHGGRPVAGEVLERRHRVVLGGTTPRCRGGRAAPRAGDGDARPRARRPRSPATQLATRLDFPAPTGPRTSVIWRGRQLVEPVDQAFARHARARRDATVARSRGRPDCSTVAPPVSDPGEAGNGSPVVVLALRCRG